MNNYEATVVRLSNVRPHSNADRLQLGTCHGNQVIVGLNDKDGDLGLYFIAGTQLSEEFCKANDLVRRKNEDGSVGGGMFDENRRVRAQKFRGEVSDGFWIPVSSLLFLDKEVNTSKLSEGYSFGDLNGVPICNKYIPKNGVVRSGGGTGKPKEKVKDSLMFKEHFDTAHFSKNLHKIPENVTLIITEKLHGTSQRVGHVLVEKTVVKSKWYNRLIDWILLKINPGMEITYDNWTYLNGTRRVVLGDPKKDVNGHHEIGLRDLAAKPFIGNLKKGETVYFEVVGYEPSGKSIMPTVDNTKIKDKEFTAKYGKTTTFSYGCTPFQSKVFVYRITTTNIDGDSIDYSWGAVKERCKELGVETVPELSIFPMDKYLDGRVNHYADQPSTLDPSHISEGVCVRYEGITPTMLKHKSFNFKVLEGITQDTGVVDMEEVQSI